MNIIKDLQLIKTYENRPVNYPLCRLQDWSLKCEPEPARGYHEGYRLSLIYNTHTTFPVGLHHNIKKDIKKKMTQTINDHVYGDVIRMLYEIEMAAIALDFQRSRELIKTTINELKDCWHEQI